VELVQTISWSSYTTRLMPWPNPRRRKLKEERRRRHPRKAQEGRRFCKPLDGWKSISEAGLRDPFEVEDACARGLFSEERARERAAGCSDVEERWHL